MSRPPGAWAVGWPTLHGGPVRLRHVRATPCFETYSQTERQRDRQIDGHRQRAD